MAKTEAKAYKIHFEVLRLLAIFLVVFNHTKEKGFDLYRYTDSAVTYYAGYSLSILCKVAVPIFFMISGALLIGREESIKDLFKKRILRIILVIIIFTLLQYIRICLAQGMQFSFATYLAYCYSGNVIEPYWYLKAYLGYLLALPFLRYIAKAMTEEGQRFFVVLCVFKVAFDVIGIVINYQPNVNIIICTDILCYPLLGYLIEEGKILTSLRRVSVALPSLLIILSLAVACGTIYKKAYGVHGEAFLSVAVMPLAALIYSLALNIRELGKKSSKAIVAVGRCVFGVYLIEDVVRNVLTYRLHWNFEMLTPLINAVCFSLVAVGLSLIIIYVVRKVPIVNKLL